MFESVNQIQDEQIRSDVISLIATRITDRHKGDHEKYVQDLEANYETLDNFVESHGWPTVDKLTALGISEEDALAVETSAFLCVQHLDANIGPRLKASSTTEEQVGRTWKEELEDSRVIERQEKMLLIMKEAGANKGMICYLTDRNLRDKDLPQKYCTQYYPLGQRGQIEINGDVHSLDDLKVDNPELIKGLLDKRMADGLTETSIFSLEKESHQPLQFLPQDMLSTLSDIRLMSDVVKNLRSQEERVTKSGEKTVMPRYSDPTTSSLLKEGEFEKAQKHDGKFAKMVREREEKSKAEEGQTR